MELAASPGTGALTWLVALEPLVGWRAWIVEERGDGPVLRSLTHATEWPALRGLEARCFRVLHRCGEAPRLGHSCGIRALRTREDALAQLPVWDGPVAVGRVSMWGRVVDEPEGWRGQFAYPYAVELLGGDRELALALRQRYCVDVDTVLD